jgi:hypothetical protein
MTTYTDEQIEEHLKLIVEGDESITKNPTILSIREEYIAYKSSFDSLQVIINNAQAKLKEMENSLYVLEGKTNAAAEMLKKFYLESLNKRDEL